MVYRFGKMLCSVNYIASTLRLTNMVQQDWQQRQSQRDAGRDGDQRTAFQRDRARVVHSAAFRRLQSKTQILGVGKSDFCRTRLTHSLEVAQIGAAIAHQLAQQTQGKAELALIPDVYLIETICLAHDLGHSAFGHGGEIALNYMMRAQGGFESNAQTFRILTRLGEYSDNHGMDLSRRTLLGVLKYPAAYGAVMNPSLPPQLINQSWEQLCINRWQPPKCVFDSEQELLDWVLAPLSSDDKARFTAVEHLATDTRPWAHGKTRYKSFDASIMELADDIAYGVHDLEDAIALGFVSLPQWQEKVYQPLASCQDAWLTEHLPTLTEKLFSGKKYPRKDAIGELVNRFVTAVSSQQQAGFTEPLLAWQARLPGSLANALLILKTFVFNDVIKRSEVQQRIYKGQLMIMKLFASLASDPQRLLPGSSRQKWLAATDEKARLRVLADYISGMTDDYAGRLYGRLFLPVEDTLLDRL
jgi:dGTPase